MLFFMIIDAPSLVDRVRPKAIDEGLFVRIGQGDRDAFEALYWQSERAIYTYALSLVKNSHDAYDIVQDTFLKVRASAHLYQARGKPLAWMFTIARNLSRNLLRGNQRQISSEEAGLSDDIQHSYISDPTDRLALETVLQRLEDGEREIILLHVVSGLKHREIAANLNVPLATVLSRYHRGLKKLKKHLVQGGIWRE